jgi:hypothetical protein
MPGPGEPVSEPLAEVAAAPDALVPEVDAAPDPEDFELLVPLDPAAGFAEATFTP